MCLSSFETIYVYFLTSFFLQVVGFLPHMGVFISLAGSWPTAKAFKLHTISFIILLFLIPSASLLHPALLRALLVTSTLGTAERAGSAAVATRLFRAFTYACVY